MIFKILSTYRTFQISARKVRSGGKGKNQDQEAVVMADTTEKVEEDARPAENKVRKKQRIKYCTKLPISLISPLKALFLLMKTKLCPI